MDSATALGGVARPSKRKASRRSQAGVVHGLSALATSASSQPARWEFGVVIFALFVLGRGPVLFLRERMADVFGGPAGVQWPEDNVIRGVFIAVEAAVIVVAVLRSRPSTLLRQPFLIVFLAVAWASLAWSERPQVTLSRVSLFIGAAFVGWFIGHRFTLRQQAWIVAGVGAAAVASTLLALVAWPDFARSTGRAEGVWSGMYGNRQVLGPVLCLGLLAAAFLFTEVDKRLRVAIGVVGAIDVYLLIRAGNRTGPIAFAVALAVSAGIFAVRRPGRAILTTPGGAVLSVGLVTIIGGLISWNWSTILDLMGRSSNLTRRTEIWDLDLRFLSMRPLTGWGFETVWANPITAQHAQAAFSGNFPHSSHSGYYEILLGVGAIGFAVFVGFLAYALWRAFLLGWRGSGVMSLWPLALLVFVVVVNLSESRWVAGEAMWSLTVSAAVAATEWAKKTPGAEPANGARG
jgi:exopolysaccharide production protein ExoQ